MLDLKLLTLSFFTVFLLSHKECFAQQPITQPKTYYDKNGTLYWNKKLPLYVSLSSSPDGSNGKVLKEENTTHVRPYFLDTEGINWIRSRWATDTITGAPLVPQHEVLWPLMADGLPPMTVAITQSTGKYVANEKTYFSGDLIITLNARDQVSGVESTYYDINGSYEKYAQPFSLPGNSKIVLKYFSNDNVGNSEDADLNNKTLREFYIDDKAPESSLKLIGPNVDNIISRKTRIELSAQDDASGVVKKTYGFNTEAILPYSSPISVATLGAEANYINYSATDHVRNRESDKRYDFFLDDQAPEVDYSVATDYFKSVSGHVFISNRSVIELKATDNKAGVNKIYFAIDNAIKSEYSAGINADQKPGLHKLIFAADDRVENMSDDRLLNYFIDIKAPSISYQATGPKLLRNDTLFVNKISSFSVTSLDAGIGQAGLRKLEYQIDEQSPVLYGGKFSIEGDGLKDLKITASDNVNNGSSVAQILFVDNVPPEIVAVYGVDKIGSKTVNGTPYTIYPKELQIYLAANDKNVGTKVIYYKINSGSRQTYTKPLTGLAAGNYSILIQAFDVLGNESSKSISFSIE